jgi:hypothetical protein
VSGFAAVFSFLDKAQGARATVFGEKGLGNAPGTILAVPKERSAVLASPSLSPAILAPSEQRRECAWCKMVLGGVSEPVTHGICPECVRAFFPDHAEEVLRG